MIEIHFKDKTRNVIEFTLIDHRDGRTETDTVRINDNEAGSPASREALDTFGFWLHLKKWVGPDLPEVICNDEETLERYHKEYCQRRFKKPKIGESWPFCNIIG